MLFQKDLVRCIAECDRTFGATVKYFVTPDSLVIKEAWFKVVFSFKNGILIRIYCFDNYFGMPYFLEFDRENLAESINYAHSLSREARRLQNKRIVEEAVIPNTEYIKAFNLEKYFPNQVRINRT